MDGLAEGDIDIIKAPIVIDNVSTSSHCSDIVDFLQGSGVMKAGIAGDSEPAL